MSKSQVSRICAALDAKVEAFRRRSLGGETYPYLWLEAMYLQVREAGWGRVAADLARHGWRLERVLSDNGSIVSDRK